MNSPQADRQTAAMSPEETQRRYNAWLGRKLGAAQVIERPDGTMQSLVFTSDESLPLCEADAKRLADGTLFSPRA